jgi:hypothetical protein
VLIIRLFTSVSITTANAVGMMNMEGEKGGIWKEVAMEYMRVLYQYWP